MGCAGRDVCLNSVQRALWCVYCGIGISAVKWSSPAVGSIIIPTLLC